MNTYTEDHLVEQPAIQLMQHELGWDVVNCYGEPSALKLRRSGWNGGLSHQRRVSNRVVWENNDFRISLKVKFSPSAETGCFRESGRHGHFALSNRLMDV
jgi:hypothetical protein